MVSVEFSPWAFSDEGTNLVLMYLPSLVHSLSEVAFSKPARSIKLCVCILASGANATQRTYQHRCLDAPPIPSLQPRSPRGLGLETGGHLPCWLHPSTGISIVEPPTPTHSTLDDNAEDTVTPVTPLVPVRARCPPIRVASLQVLLVAEEVGHDFFSLMRARRSDPSLGSGRVGRMEELRDR